MTENLKSSKVGSVVSKATSHKEEDKRAGLILKYARTLGDTGSPEVQVALLTHDINELNQHFSTHPKDHHSKQGLLKRVGQRRKLLSYLKSSSLSRYTSLIQSLELRK